MRGPLVRMPVRVNPVLEHPSERRSALNREWRFRLDPDDRGVGERWFADASALTERIAVPGCWQGQGFGHAGKDEVADFRLQARVFQATYTGTGWYAQTFRPLPDWRGKRLWLNFGGVYPTAEVWLNGARLGENHEPFVPFGFEVTELASPDRDNEVVLRVCEEDRWLGLAYNWQGNWSGLYRDVELAATGQAFLEQAALYPSVDEQQMGFRVIIGGFRKPDRPLTLEVGIHPLDRPNDAVSWTQAVTRARMEFSVPVPDPLLWSPDSPGLYRVDAVLWDEEEIADALSERVGFVKLSTESKHFLIDDEPYYMRGTGDFISCPETGCPDTSRDRWRRKLATLRAYGYNYVRCQSYVYAPEYLDAADEVGLLVQSEMGMLGAWGGHTAWHIYAWPQPMAGVRRALKSQWDHVVLRDVNHPSANLYCMSNELGANTLFPRTAWQCYHDTKAIKPTALVLWTDGGHNDALPEDFVNAEASIDATCDKPLIQHEYRWWSSFPDVRTAGKYSGAVRPYAAEIAREAAAGHGIARVLPRAAEMSQRLQLVEAKGKMELCRRDNPTLAGICHFNAMDANPSPQGIIDEFYEPKVTSAETWLQTNGDTVILAGLGFDDRIRCGGETLACELYASDFSHPPLARPTLEWAFTVDGKTVDEGHTKYQHAPYRTCEAARVETAVPDVETPVRARLAARLREGRRAFTNQWDFWLFPSQAPPAAVTRYGKARYTWLRTLAGAPSAGARQLDGLPRGTLVVTERLDQALVKHLQAGGRALLAASEGLVRPFNPKFGFTLGHYFFTPPANYPPYEDGHDGTIILSHPMLADFPHEGFADLQFFRLISDSPPLELEPLALNDADPVIRVMHCYPVGRSLGYLTERRVGKGLLIVCALDLNQAWPEARHLLGALGRYAARKQPPDAPVIAAEALQRITSITTGLP